MCHSCHIALILSHSITASPTMFAMGSVRLTAIRTQRKVWKSIIEPVRKKSNDLGSDQVRCKSVRTATEAG